MPANGPRLADVDLTRLHHQSGAERWGVDVARFSAALEASLERMFRGVTAERRDVARQAAALHLEDLALATACADGHDGAWDHFIREHRPGLYRAADALDPGGGARELADALYGDLYGLPNGAGERRSLLVYYHGRSALGTWLRAVLAQRVVDRGRTARRLAPLPEESELASRETTAADPEQPRRASLIARALIAAVAALANRDRWRLGCYYQQQLTLAETGRLLAEHEATVSRQLARTRRALRADIEARLRTAGLSGPEIAECFAAAVGEASPVDLGAVFARKNLPTGRST